MTKIPNFAKLDCPICCGSGTVRIPERGFKPMIDLGAAPPDVPAYDVRTYPCPECVGWITPGDVELREQYIDVPKQFLGETGYMSHVRHSAARAFSGAIEDEMMHREAGALMPDVRPYRFSIGILRRETLERLMPSIRRGRKS